MNRRTASEGSWINIDIEDPSKVLEEEREPAIGNQTNRNQDAMPTSGFSS